MQPGSRQCGVLASRVGVRVGVREVVKSVGSWAGRARSLLSAFLPSSSFTQETVRAVAQPGASAPPWGRRAPPGEKPGHSLRLPLVWAGVEGQGELRWKEKGFLALPRCVLLRASAASGYFTHTLEYTSSFFKRAITGQGAKCSKSDSALGPSHHETPGTGLPSQVSSEADPEWGSRKAILKRWETDRDQRKYFPILRP